MRSAPNFCQSFSSLAGVEPRSWSSNRWLNRRCLGGTTGGRAGRQPAAGPPNGSCPSRYHRRSPKSIAPPGSIGNNSRHAVSISAAVYDFPGFMTSFWRRLGPLVGIALFVVALLYLWRELHALTLTELWRTTQGI